MSPRVPSALGFAVVVAMAMALGGCATGSAPTQTPTPQQSYAATGDGVLRIGTIFPTSGAAAFIGPAQVAGVEVAVREINEAGGVGGVPVEVYHRNSGDALTQVAEESFAALVAKGVDVVVGPSSSVLAERLVTPAVAAGVPLISPAATYPGLSAIDDSGMLFRTIASYAVQGIAIADLLGDGARVAIVHSTGDLGASIEKSLTAAVDARKGTVVASVPVAPSDTEFSKGIAAVAAGKPDAVVLATTVEFPAQNTALITQLSAAGFGGATLWLTSQNLADYSQALAPGLLTGVNGVLEGAQPDAAFTARLLQADPALTDFRYALEAYDATILAALAAVAGADDGGPAISRALRGVSTGGITCASFGECLDVLNTEKDIDYDGVSGSVNFTDSGDVTAGTFGVFAYTAENTYGFVKSVRAHR